MFFIPECGCEYVDLKKIIIQNGGIVVEQHECFTYQIKPQNAKLKSKDFYEGQIYHSDWITSMVTQNAASPQKICGNLMNDKKDDFFLRNNDSSHSKKLNISKKKKFTIVEGIKMFSIINSNASENLNKQHFWQRLCEQKMIPERTPEQLKKFWLTYKDLNPEQWLAQAIHENVDFSFSLQ